MRHCNDSFINRFVVSALVVFVASFAFSANARAYTGQELQLWTQAGVRANVTEKLQLGLDQHARFVETMSEVARWYTDVEVAYDLPRHFEVGAGYRFMLRNDKDPSCCRHRFNGDVKYTLDAGELLRFDFRLRGQGTLLENKAMRYVVRTQFEMMLILFKVARPFIGSELFARVFEDGGPEFDSLRLDSGVVVRLMKDWKLVPMYRFQIPATQADRLQHIIGIGTRYSFD